MSKLESALKQLAKGSFVCPIQFPEEFEVLSSEAGRSGAEAWLKAVGYRLARLSEEGAFFMAYDVPTSEMRTRLRDELKTIRNRLEPYVGFLETLRQAQGRNPQLHAGDVVWLTEISEAVRGSTMLDRRLLDMRELADGRVSDGGATVHRIQRMFNILVEQGYLVESNFASKGYTFTGKMDYLYQLIAFIAENTPHLSDDQVVDQMDPQARLDMADVAEPAPDAQP
ncbi:hypothetical protein [Acidovorax sp.]|uniref:hypothetical protein n=1 Tax=Acidovorax sp. TaxID=1872122 RepID=UPI00391FA27C